MDEYLQTLLQYIFGGSITGGIALGAIALLRKLWRGDQIATADATGNVTAVDKLLKVVDQQQEQIAQLRSALTEAQARADRAYDDRNKLVNEVGTLRGEIAALRREISMLKGELNDQMVS